MSTYTQLYIHIVFRVKNKRLKLDLQKRTHVYKYMNGIINNLGHKTMIINGVEDHVHILVSFAPDKTISDLVKEIKRCSTKYINQNGFSNTKFAWQEGFGAFIYSKSQIKILIAYIKNK